MIPAGLATHQVITHLWKQGNAWERGGDDWLFTMKQMGMLESQMFMGCRYWRLTVKP